MATKAQIKANQQNALKSAGPQTAEGKAIAAKNAVKHGLFACEDVITGEDPADYDALHDAIIAELAPSGVMETIFAERIVSLTWRLQRAERMQTQALEVKLARDEPGPLQKQLTAMLPAHLRKVQDDPRGAGPDLVLGRVVIKDYADARILERLSMYEKRIEGSLFRTIKELDRRKLMRQIELEEADKETAEYETRQEKRSQSFDTSTVLSAGYAQDGPAGLLPEIRSSKSEILNSIKCPKDLNSLHRMPYGKNKSACPAVQIFLPPRARSFYLFLSACPACSAVKSVLIRV